MKEFIAYNAKESIVKARHYQQQITDNINLYGTEYTKTLQYAFFDFYRLVNEFKYEFFMSFLK